MATFRKKPIVIEAVRVSGEPAPQWLADAFQIQAGHPGSVWRVVDYDGLLITTLEGTMRAEVGDWIIRGVTGELYPCKPDVFAATYDPVPEAGASQELEAVSGRLA